MVLWTVCLVFGFLSLEKKYRFNPIFIGYLFIYLLLLFSINIDDSIKYNGLYIILLFFIFSYLGFYAVMKININTKYSSRKIEFNKSRLRNIILFLLFVIIPISLINIFSKGVRLNNLFNLESLLEINEASAFNRYSGNNSFGYLNILNSLKINCMYVCSLFSGIYFSLFDKKSYLPFYIFVVTILELLFSNGKLGLIVITMLFLIGIIMTQIIAEKEQKIKKKIYLKMFLFIIIIFFILYTSMLLRVGRFDFHIRQQIQRKFVNYACGSMYAFNSWFNSIRVDLPIFNFGTQTFTGIFNLIGVVVREQGVYKNMFHSSVWNTNVYTSFRGVISDFGMIGFLLFAFILGVISAWSYKNWINKKTRVSFICLGMIYLFYIYSFIISPYIYSSLTFVFPLSVVVLIVERKYKWKKIKLR